MVEPHFFLLRIHARVAFDRILDGEQQFHAGEAARIAARDGGRQGVDDEPRTHSGEALVRRLGFQPLGFGLGEALDRLAGKDSNLLGKIHALAFRFAVTREDGEHGSQMQHMRIQMGVAERRRAVHELLVYPGLITVRERIRYFDDHHSIEKRLILLLLEETVEFGEIGMGENGLIEIDQRKPRNLDVLFLRHRQQKVEELALDLEDLDHLEDAAARGIHRAGP